jgi:hypothetical protein
MRNLSERQSCMRVDKFYTSLLNVYVPLSKICVGQNQKINNIREA